ncbi:MBL fold metallo-hydrolase [Pseudenhygromyxa sp. WMMC2535]|uniref:ComEC/Rec2 family competence protein n=1 Tax=Pseudenhygromyxa sp. WMMC2535 TaxID=2712867 RepID=UPI001553C884|nr:MBL fold metallo-hydrolase [Pseudenhygromyxa sp. WMMC2535]NVB41846.1 MBL fold metallo-hydrolase [Pseudenhygromyxa sp. WMMC2535]
MNTAITTFALASGLASGLLANLAQVDAPPGPGLHFVDVGQGSAVVIHGSGGEVVIVDSGPPAGAEALRAALERRAIDRVSLWIHSHYDADHLGGFPAVVAGRDRLWPSEDDLVVEALWDRGLDAPLPETDAMSLYLELAGDRRARPAPGAVFSAPGLRVEALAADPPAVDAEENARGLTICLELEGLRVLLPGDQPAAAVEAAAAACGPVDLLWLSHHGALGGTSVAALAMADPRAVVISAGHENGYCHPATPVLARLGEIPTWILDGAGIDPRGSCEPMAASLAASQRLIGGDLWVGPGLEAWIALPGAGFVPSS